ncbi:MAG TPA: aldehyde dehydrogenase family protein [Roseiflexaceae bacterium]|nr:aldehyde dehydrogenase family protein [Roseiflexaceae bacterium]
MPHAADLPERRMYLAGEWRSGTPYPIFCPHDALAVALVHRAGAADLEQAIQAAVDVLPATRRMPAHQRAAILRRVAAGISARAEELARIIALEAAKPIKQARIEVGRSIATFSAAADEATRSHDEALRLDAAAGGEQREAVVRRFPIGPVAAIAPFNFPLNLVAHKVAPALAAGCPLVLNRASQTPGAALVLAEIIAATEWPAAALSVLPLASSDAAPLVEDPRFALLSFTGSPAVGWGMKQRAGRKRVTLELGGNAGCIIHSDADLSFAAARCAVGGFSHAGQSCISVQRIFVQQAVYEAFLAQFLPRVQALRVGHPLDEQSDLSALISRAEAERVADWLDEAHAAGATILTGGQVSDGIIAPTVVADAGPQLNINCREVFAPLVTIQPYDTFEQALAAVNDSDYGLQAGVFTRDVGRIYQAYETLEVGGVIINDVPTWRIDPMPYGGIKGSGFGREGLRYAIEEMTEPKLLVINLG